ncbi:MAG: patatin-like phospholipase family protein [Chloracidobacterium sp.]|nr:patatin-like phospholipase family protein [Chloracidobacterium sp.]
MKIGLALSGGGARGFAHIGAMKVLAEHDVPVDLIAGTSAGSIIGGALAAGMSISEVETMAAAARWRDLARPSLPIGGLLSNEPMGGFLRRHFPVDRFEDLKRPFTAAAFDLGTNTPVLLSKRGDLITAIRASCAVPGIFSPVRDEQRRMLIDGGVVSPLPVQTVRAMGAGVVIAIDLISCGATFRTSSKTGFGVLIQGALALLKVVATAEQRAADIVVAPAIAHLRPDQIGKREEFIALGEAAAREKIADILRLIA